MRPLLEATGAFQAARNPLKQTPIALAKSKFNLNFIEGTWTGEVVIKTKSIGLTEIEDT